MRRKGGWMEGVWGGSRTKHTLSDTCRPHKNAHSFMGACLLVLFLLRLLLLCPCRMQCVFHPHPFGAPTPPTTTSGLWYTLSSYMHVGHTLRHCVCCVLRASKCTGTFFSNYTRCVCDTHTVVMCRHETWSCSHTHNTHHVACVIRITMHTCL